MNCVITDHDYFSCYKHDVSLCFLESRIIVVSANVFCWLYPTINKVYLILSYLILSYLTSGSGQHGRTKNRLRRKTKFQTHSSENLWVTSGRSEYFWWGLHRGYIFFYLNRHFPWFFWPKQIVKHWQYTKPSWRQNHPPVNTMTTHNHNTITSHGEQPQLSRYTHLDWLKGSWATAAPIPGRVWFGLELSCDSEKRSYLQAACRLGKKQQGQVCLPNSGRRHMLPDH